MDLLGEDRRNVTALIVAGVVAILLLFGFLIWWLVGQRTGMGRTAITTSTQTTVYVDPAKCPLCTDKGSLATNGTTGTGGSTGSGSGSGSNGSTGTGGTGGQTPDVSGQASSGGTVSSGGIFGGLFGGGTPKDLPQGYAAKDLSPLFRKVRISGVQINTRQVATAADTITIRENIGSGDGAINLTGMRIKGNQGNYAIQRGAKIYKTTGSALGNITLADGQSANIYAGTSAVSANFMGNSCMGYLMASYPFVPKIAGGTCTRPAKTEIATFSGACQDYILKLKTCETGNASDSRIPASDSACRSFVSNINYDGCVKTYQANTKFFSNVWHVWSGKSFLDPLHDQVLLLDANGKLVDYYLY